MKLSATASQLEQQLRQDGQASISPDRFCDWLGISSEHLAATVHVGHAALRQDPGLEQVESYLRDAISVIGLAMDLNGGSAACAIDWYRKTPLVELGGQTAEWHVAAGKAQAIRDYVCNLSAGATG
jgi:hypothetical protein